MTSHRILIITFFSIIIAFHPLRMWGQSYSVTRIEHYADIKTNGTWNLYKSAKSVGKLAPTDSIHIDEGQIVAFQLPEEKKLTICGPTSGSIASECEAVRKSRKANLQKLASNNNSLDALGEVAMAFRGDETFESIGPYFRSQITSSKRIIKNLSLSISRHNCKDGYYYEVCNNSNRKLFVTIIEICGNSIIDVDKDLINMQLNIGDSPDLSNYILSNTRKENSFYAIGSFFPIPNIIDVLNAEENLQSKGNRPENDFSMIIAGHR